MESLFVIASTSSFISHYNYPFEKSNPITSSGIHFDDDGTHQYGVLSKLTSRVG